MFFFACGIFNVCLGSLAVRLDSSARCRDGARAHTRMAIKTCMCTAILNRFESWLTAIYSLLFSYQQNVFHILFPTRSWTTEEITMCIHCAGTARNSGSLRTLNPSPLLRQSECRASNAHAVTGPLFTGPAMKTKGKKYMTFEKGSEQ